MMDSLFLTLTPRDRTLPIHLTSVGYWVQGPIDRPEGFPDFHWLHTVKGTGTVWLDGETRTLSRGLGFFMFPGMPHRYVPNDSWEVMFVTFNGNGLHAFLTSWGLLPGFVELVDEERLSQSIKMILALGSEQSSYRNALAAPLVYQFIVDLIHQDARRPHAKRLRERLRPVVDRIEATYADAPSLGELSRSIGVSPQHLCRMFQRVYGTTPGNYLTSVRIRKAKELLIYRPDVRISDIAAIVGFESHTYFCSVFKRREHMTPTQFRRMYSDIDVDATDMFKSLK